MRIALALLLAIALAAPIGARAGADKQLENVKGAVSYQHGSASAHKLAHSASVLLNDNDVAITGNASEAAVALPDSSRVTMGSDTRVQLAFFNQAEQNSAKFIVYQGKTRFKVEHPAGARANYTFVTPTASVAVRGTEGDIGVDGQNLVVNVYGLSDPNLPVLVDTNDGQHFTLKAGQQLLAQWVNGKIQATIGALTQQALAQFDELGAPASNWAAAAASLRQNPCSAAADQVSKVTGGLFGGLVHAAVSKPCESAAPSPQPTGTP